MRNLRCVRVHINPTFPDRDSEKRALAVLIGRFPGSVLRTGDHLVPEVALKALAEANIPVTIKAKTTSSN